MQLITGVDILDEEIKEKLKTENIYKIFNNFIFPLIAEEEREFLEELESFLLKNIEPKMNLTEEVYNLFPILGQKNYIQRLNPYGEFERYNMRYEMLLAMATSIIDPELDDISTTMIVPHYWEGKRQKPFVEYRKCQECGRFAPFARRQFKYCRICLGARRIQNQDLKQD